MIPRLQDRLRGPARHPRLAVVGLILLALLLRAWDIDRMSIWQDEGLTLYRASLGAAGILSGEIPLDALTTQDVQPPLYFLLLAAWLGQLGLPVGASGSIWAGKWLSLLVSLPAVPLTWALTKRVLKRPFPGLGAVRSDREPADARAGEVPMGAAATRSIALLAALLAALSPAMLWYSQELRSYSLQVTLGLFSVYALLRALEAWGAGPRQDAATLSDGQTLVFAVGGGRRPALAWASACILTGAALVWTHYLSFFLLAFEGLVVLVYGLRRRDWRSLAPLLLLGLAAAPLLPYALWRLGIGAERDQRFVPLRTILRDISFGIGFGKSAHGWNLAAPGAHLGMLAAELAFAGLLLAGGLRLWRSRRGGAALVVAGYLLIPVLGLYALTWIKPVYMGVRHILLAAPAAWILAAVGLRDLEDRRSGFGLSLGLLAGLGMLASLRGFYQEPAFAKDDHRALADYVLAHAVEPGSGQGDLLVVPHPVLQHTYKPLLGDSHLGIQTLPPFLASGLTDERPPGEFLRPLLAEHARIWFIDPPERYEDWLRHNALEVDRKDFPASSIVLDLHAYERDPRLDTEEAPTRRERLRLGGLSLLGWEPLPALLVAGEAGRLRLVWKVEERELPDYKVAFELIGPDGVNVAEGDHEPFHGLNPSSGWDFGSTIYEPHDLLVSAGAPSGSYRLMLRVYDPAGGEAFPPEGPAELGSVEVIQDLVPPDLQTLDIQHRVQGQSELLELVGFDLPEPEGEAWPAGARLPLDVWVEDRGLALDRALADASIAPPVDEPDEQTPLGAETEAAMLRAQARAPRFPAALRAELVDSWGRIRASQQVALPEGSADHYWRIPLPLDLPAAAGRYDLRLRLIRADGGSQGLLRGDPLPILPVRALWLTGIDVAAAERVTAAPEMAHALEATVGGKAELLGYDAPDGDFELLEGGALPLTLYWRSLAEMSTRYRVTIQLLPLDPATGEPSGPPLAQHDDEPAAGARPTTGWTPGEVVTDAHLLSLPDALEPGDYLLIAALYDPEHPELPRPEVSQSGALRDYVVLRRLSLDGRGAPAEPDDEDSIGDDG